MNIKRQELNIALGHLIAWLLFFPALVWLPLEEPRRDLVAGLALAPWEDQENWQVLSISRLSEFSGLCKAGGLV